MCCLCVRVCVGTWDGTKKEFRRYVESAKEAGLMPNSVGKQRGGRERVHARERAKEWENLRERSMEGEERWGMPQQHHHIVVCVWMWVYVGSGIVCTHAHTHTHTHTHKHDLKVFIQALAYCQKSAYTERVIALAR